MKVNSKNIYPISIRIHMKHEKIKSLYLSKLEPNI